MGQATTTERDAVCAPSGETIIDLAAAEETSARAMRIGRLLSEVGGGQAVARIDLVVRGDRDGHQAAAVLAEVARVAWGAPLDTDGMWLQGIGSLTNADEDNAEREGRKWRLVASATAGCAKVEPSKVPMDSPLARDYLADVVQVHLVKGGVLTLHATTPKPVAA